MINQFAGRKRKYANKDLRTENILLIAVADVSGCLKSEFTSARQSLRVNRRYASLDSTFPHTTLHRMYIRPTLTHQSSLYARTFVLPLTHQCSLYDLSYTPAICATVFRHFIRFLVQIGCLPSVTSLFLHDVSNKTHKIAVLRSHFVRKFIQNCAIAPPHTRHLPVPRSFHHTKQSFLIVKAANFGYAYDG